MRLFKIIPRILSLFIAGVNAYAIYFLHQYEKAHRFGIPLWGEEGELLTSIAGAVILIGLPLICIWFGEYMSEFADQRAEWAPMVLIKFAGWVFLLIPAILFIWYKIK